MTQCGHPDLATGNLAPGTFQASRGVTCANWCQLRPGKFGNAAKERPAVREHNIAVIAGDGIGKEVVPVGCRVLQAAEQVIGGFHLIYDHFPWGCEYYEKTGRMMDTDGLDRLAHFDAIYLGAVGWPTVADHISLWGLLLPIRQTFNQYVNLRPIRLLPGLRTPLRDKNNSEIDMVCIRENVEGEYAGVGWRYRRGQPDEIVHQVGVFTRCGVERVMRYAFELARRRPARRLTSATKSNALQYSMVFWDEVFRQLAAEYPDVTTEISHVDALAARMITHPETLDVIVGSNLFGDILTDLGGALQGSLGIAASANLNPEGEYPSMFESVHGSAPDIAGQDRANPVATIWAGALMLESLGEVDAAALVMAALERVLAESEVRTADLGGRNSTEEVGNAIVRAALELGNVLPKPRAIGYIQPIKRQRTRKAQA